MNLDEALIRITELETALKPFAEYEKTLRCWRIGGSYFYQPAWDEKLHVAVGSYPIDHERVKRVFLWKWDFERATKALT